MSEWVELRVGDVYAPDTGAVLTGPRYGKNREMMVDYKRTTRLAIVFFVAVALFWAPGAGAQQGPPETTPGNGPPFDDPNHPCYPDGCGRPTTTTTAPRPGPTCGVSLDTSVVGAEVQATVRNVPAGGTVRLVFDGREVARGTNAAGAQSIRAMPTQTADVTMSFIVPDVPPGEYTLVAVGDTFTITCGGGGFKVLAASGGGGALAFTGASIFGLVLLGLALLAVGYYLVRRNRSARA